MKQLKQVFLYSFFFIFVTTSVVGPFGLSVDRLSISTEHVPTAWAVEGGGGGGGGDNKPSGSSGGDGELGAEATVAAGAAAAAACLALGSSSSVVSSLTGGLFGGDDGFGGAYFCKEYILDEIAFLIAKAAASAAGNE